MLIPAAFVIVRGHRRPRLFRTLFLSHLPSLFPKYPSGGLGGGNEPPNTKPTHHFPLDPKDSIWSGMTKNIGLRQK
jgi:hypothetical protein